MAVSGEFIEISNVRQFTDVQVRHAEQLVRGGIIWDDMVPRFLQPFTQRMGSWNGRDDWASPHLDPSSRGRAVGTEDHAHIGGQRQRQIVAKPGFEVAGRTQTVSSDDFTHPMGPEIARQKITEPEQEFTRAVAEGLLNMVMADQHDNSAYNEGQTFHARNFDGVDTVVDTVSESADEASATVAGSHHSINWPDKQGGTFSSGHDHIQSNTGGWSESKAETARDHLLEHPGQNGPVWAFVGATVRDSVETDIESVRSGTESGVDFEQLNPGPEEQFGVPSEVGTHDGVRYFHVGALPDQFAIYMDSNVPHIGLWMGEGGEDGQTRKQPRAWNNRGQQHPETDVTEYGFRGYAVPHVTNPVGIFLHDYS